MQIFSAQLLLPDGCRRVKEGCSRAVIVIVTVFNNLLCVLCSDNDSMHFSDILLQFDPRSLKMLTCKQCGFGQHQPDQGKGGLGQDGRRRRRTKVR